MFVGATGVGRVIQRTLELMAERDTSPAARLHRGAERPARLIRLVCQLILAAGLAIGLALQGTLANFAGGVLILFFKPFKVGDLIEAQGYLGIVKEIQIFVTILTTLDNQRIIIPNGLLSNGCLTNLNAEPQRRVDMVFGISYSDDVLKVKRILQDLIAADSRVLAEPQSEVYVKEHGDSSINMLVRVWVKPEDYWGVYFDMHEQVKLTFDREGVSIPFPQRDVHMIPA